MTARFRRRAATAVAVVLALALGVVVAVALSHGPSPRFRSPATRATLPEPDVPPDAVEVTATIGTSPLPAGTPGVGTAPVVLGSKDFPEQDLLGALYARALQAKGYRVVQKPDIGPSEVIDRAFAADQIQMYPEYLGEIATGGGLADQPTPPNASSTYRIVQQWEQSQRQAVLFKQTPFQNIDVIVVTSQLAGARGLESIGDLNTLGPAGAGVKVAAQPSFRIRQAGLVGLARRYGLTKLDAGFVRVLAGSQVYQALDTGAADAGDGFSTDPQLLGDGYTTLKDPKNVFGSQHVAPVVKQATAERMGPEFTATCDWVSGLLSTTAIQQLNQAVGDGQDPATVATTFLQRNGLR